MTDLVEAQFTRQQWRELMDFVSDRVGSLRRNGSEGEMRERLIAMTHELYEQTQS